MTIGITQPGTGAARGAVNTVDDLLGMQSITKEMSSSSPGLASNLSFVCKQQSTISIATCLPGDDSGE